MLVTLDIDAVTLLICLVSTEAFEWSCVSETGGPCALTNFATPTATDGSGTAGAQITVAGGRYECERPTIDSAREATNNLGAWHV